MVIYWFSLYFYYHFGILWVFSLHIQHMTITRIRWPVYRSIDIVAAHFYQEFDFPRPRKNNVRTVLSIKIKREVKNVPKIDKREWKQNVNRDGEWGSNRISNGTRSFEFLTTPFTTNFEWMQFSNTIDAYQKQCVIYSLGTFETEEGQTEWTQKCQKTFFLLLLLCPLSTYFRFNFTLSPRLFIHPLFI